VAQTYALSNLGRQQSKILNVRRLISLEIFMAKGKHSRTVQAMITTDNLPGWKCSGLSRKPIHNSEFSIHPLWKSNFLFFSYWQALPSEVNWKKIRY